MSQIVGNLVVELSFDGSKFTQGLTQAKRELSSYGKAMQSSLNVAKDQNYSFDSTTKALNNMKVTYQGLAGTREQAIAQMKKLEEAGKQNTSTYAKLKSDVSNYSDQMLQLNKQYQDVQKKMYTADSVFTKIGNGLTTVGRGMANAGTLIDNVGQGITRVGVMATAAGAAFVKQSVEYERGMIQVQKTTNASDEQIREFSRQIKEMAGVMPVGIFELQNLAAIAGQLGIKQKDLAYFTETMAKVGTATTLSSEEASESLARFTNVSGTGVDTLENLGSSLVALGNNLATTETEIMNMAGLLVGTLTTLGASEADILGLSGAMSSLGITAERGGSSISKFFVDLAVAVADGGTDLANFAEIAGMSSEKFSQLFKQDSVSAFTSFIDGLKNIKDAGGDVVKTLDDLGINEIRMRDTILKLVNGNDLLHKSLKLSNEEFSKGTALQNEYDQQLKSTASQWEIAKNKIALVGIEIGDALLPAINDLLNNSDGLIDMAKGFAEWFTGLDDGVKRNLVSLAAFSPIIGGAVSAFGTLLKMGSAIVQFFGALNKGMGALQGAYRAWKAGDILGHVKSLGSKFALLNPQVLAVAASIGVLYGAWKVLGEEAWNAQQRMREFPDITGITETQATSLRNMSDSLVAINTEMSMLGDGADVEKIATGMGDLATEIGRLNTEKIATLREEFSKLPTDVQEALKESLEQTIANIEDQTSRVEQIAKRMSEIAKVGLDENGILMEQYMLEMQILTDEMMSNYSYALADSAEQQVEIYGYLTKSVSEMTLQELEKREEYLQKAFDSEMSSYEEHSKKLFDWRKDQTINEEAYQKGLEQLQVGHNTRMMALKQELAKTELENRKRWFEKDGEVLNENHRLWQQVLQQIAEETGLTFEQVEAIAKSTDLSAPFEKMSTEAKRAYAELITAKNTLAEKLGIKPSDIGIEHIEEFISYAKEAGLTWNDLELLSKDANIDDNTRAFLEKVLESYSVWDSITFEERVAKITTEGKDALQDMLEHSEMWNSLSVEQKTAIITSVQNGERISDVLSSMGLWNSLTLSEKLALVATEGHESMEQLLEEYRVFDSLPEGVTKEMVLEAIANGKLDVEQFIQTWQGTVFQDKIAQINTSVDPSDAVRTFITFWLLSVLGLGDKNVNIDATDNATDPTQDAIDTVNEFGALTPNPKLEATNNASSKAITAKADIDRFGASRPNPTLNATNNASWKINAVGSELSYLNGRTAHTYIYTHNITTSSTRRLATGTSKHYGGLAVLGDGGKPEPFLTPSGHFGVSPSHDTLYDLPIGTKVWPSVSRFKTDAQNNGMLQRYMNLLPHFKNGTDDSFLNTMKLPFKSSAMDSTTTPSEVINFNIELSVVGNSISPSQADKIIEPLVQAAERFTRKRRGNIRLGGV